MSTDNIAAYIKKQEKSGEAKKSEKEKKKQQHKIVNSTLRFFFPSAFFAFDFFIEICYETSFSRLRIQVPQTSVKLHELNNTSTTRKLPM